MYTCTTNQNIMIISYRVTGAVLYGKLGRYFWTSSSSKWSKNQ